MNLKNELFCDVDAENYLGDNVKGHYYNSMNMGDRIVHWKTQTDHFKNFVRYFTSALEKKGDSPEIGYLDYLGNYDLFDQQVCPIVGKGDPYAY